MTLKDLEDALILLAIISSIGMLMLVGWRIDRCLVHRIERAFQKPPSVEREDIHDDH